MLKVVFFAESQDLFAEYTSRLNENNIRYWAITGGNDFYRLQAQIHIDILFLDYQMFDHNLFDVRSYSKSFRKDLILLFFNYPKEHKKSVLATWQDDLSLFYKDLISEEIYLLLSLMCSRSRSFTDEKVVIDSAQEDNKHYNLNHNNSHMVFSEGMAKGFRYKDCSKEYFSEKNASALQDNNKILYYYSKLKDRFKMGFSEYMLLDFLYARRNSIVSVQEMVNLIWQDNSNSHVNTLYSYVHSLRNFLCNIKIPASIVRIKKGYYSLIVERDFSVSELNL